MDRTIAKRLSFITAVPTLIEQLQLFMGVTIRNVTVTS